MVRKARVPIEERSYSLHFFILAALLIGSTGWAVWDEVEGRRPWKEYQREYNRLEYTALKGKFDKAERALIAEKARLAGGRGSPPADIEEVERRLEAAVRRVARDPGYRRATARLAEIERGIRRAEERMRFAKSEAEEDFYRWKHALGKGYPYQRYKDAWFGRRAQVAGIERELRGLKAERDRVEARLGKFEAKLRELRRAREDLVGYRDALRERLEKVRARPLAIQQVVLPAYDKNNFGEPQDRVDRCTSCHVGIDRDAVTAGLPLVFASHPRRAMLLGNHPVERFGCTPCHRGQGAALTAKDAHGYEEREAKVGEGTVRVREPLEHWEEPMYQGQFIESSCASCHQTFEVAGAGTLNKARLLFTELGCHGCHLTAGFEGKAKIGPDLTRIGAKVFPEWLVRWIENPKSYLARTRMPNYRFSRGQAISIAAYLLRSSAPYRFPGGAELDGSANRGKALVQGLGCLGCHSVGEYEAGGYLAPLGYDLVPDLRRIASKARREWIFDWLKDPRRFRPTTKMPNLRLSDDEARDITAYLLTLGEPPSPDFRLRTLLASDQAVERGRKLIYDYGCYSCHEVKGFESASRIAPPLSEFGAKDPKVELYFGDALASGAYRLEFGRDPVTWENWTFNKLKSPRIYGDEVAEAKMPDFGLSDENARALLVLLRTFTGEVAPEAYRRGLTEEEAAIEKGKNLIRNLNCVGCHEIDGSGGDIRRYYADPAMAPPVLTGEGDKVQAGWLFRFLKKPIPLRPWLRVRMPTFGLTDAQASTIVEYFNALSSRKIPFAFFDAEQVSDESRREGRRLFGMRGSADYGQSLKCDSCHPRGNLLPGGNAANWGPDLGLARQRLKPEWIVEWLRNPQRLQPGTRMPNFFYDYERYDSKVEVTELMENPEAKILALRDFLMSMEE